MPTASPSRRRDGGILPLFPALAVPAVLSLLGWAASYLYNLFNSDVTMPDWSVNLALYAAEILPALRSAVLLAFVACFAWAGERIGRIVWIAACGIFSNILFGIGATWLSEGFGVFNPLTLFTDLILCAAAFFIGRAVRRKADRSSTPRGRKTWSPRKAALFAAIPAAVLPVLYAALDLAEHIGNRGAYTEEVWAGGIAFFAGTLVRRILIWGVLGCAAAWFSAGLLRPKQDRGAKF